MDNKTIVHSFKSKDQFMTNFGFGNDDHLLKLANQAIISRYRDEDDVNGQASEAKMKIICRVDGKLNIGLGEDSWYFHTKTEIADIGASSECQFFGDVNNFLRWTAVNCAPRVAVGLSNIRCGSSILSEY